MHDKAHLSINGSGKAMALPLALTFTLRGGEEKNPIALRL
jgi:hypothetical protein